ncbi:hypothetical protein Hanom_Chr09g00840001 [Helianthus anomalus]
MNYRAQTNTLPNVHERTRHLFVFVHLTKRTKILVCVRLFNKRTSRQTVDELFAECLIR